MIHAITNSAPATDHPRLRAAAEALEVSFVTEMLRAAGFDQAQDALGGGIGEDQFSSFLLETRAESLVRAGGFGLSERIFEALKRMETQDDA